MKRKKRQTLYEILTVHSTTARKKDLHAEKIEIGKQVRLLRKTKNLSGVEFCRRAGNLNPKTLTAVEKGRIKNPSVQTLKSLAHGLDMTISDLFRTIEVEFDRNIYASSQRGFYEINFYSGVKMISLTPFIHEFFCGKLILGARKRVDQTLLKHPRPFFISNLIGRFEITVEDKKIPLKEGENLYFNGAFRHLFYNPLERESTLLVVTAPSFV
ncbi:MAG: helix-turn-helix transcriptional regulator [Candidatus Omnitrophica bacterium]|nr:helix-turn-helix transcriptional regulator [Candidatus Omnitrophota bacterium]